MSLKMRKKKDKGKVNKDKKKENVNETEKIKKPPKKVKEKKKRITLKSPASFSIAFQMSYEQLSARILGSLIADILYAMLTIAAVVYNAVVSVNGSFTGLRGVSITLESSGTILDRLGSAAVNVTTAQGDAAAVAAGAFAQFLYVTLVAVLVVEFAVLLVSCVVIPNRTYERLKPLYNMTEAAQALKNIDITGSENSTDNGNIEIHTGKEELVGLEDAVNDLLRRTRNSYQSQIRFVSDAAHELRTPIAVIQGYASMLERWGREDKEILDESIDSIKSEAENMNRLVENLLFLARGDSGRAVIRFEQLDINSLICDIYEEFVMIDKSHEFRLDLRCDVTARVDPSLIKQCLRILIDNAIKYSPEKTDIIIRLQKRDEEHFSIDIQDNGIGISHDDIDKIFERFYRSDPARNRASGGCGLGLSIAKWIVDKHSGFFEVLSYEKIGTRISVVLPYDCGGEDENT